MSLQWHINHTHVSLPREPSQRDVAPHTTAILGANAEKYQISHIKKQYDCRQGSILQVYNLYFEVYNMSKQRERKLKIYQVMKSRLAKIV